VHCSGIGLERAALIPLRNSPRISDNDQRDRRFLFLIENLAIVSLRTRGHMAFAVNSDLFLGGENSGGYPS
jgi:hypothetical protein